MTKVTCHVAKFCFDSKIYYQLLRVDSVKSFSIDSLRDAFICVFSHSFSYHSSDQSYLRLFLCRFFNELGLADGTLYRVCVKFHDFTKEIE